MPPAPAVWIRLFGFVLLVVAAVYFLVPSTSTVSRPSRPIVAPPTGSGPGTAPAFKRRIVAVGDLHGDLPNALSVLKMSAVIDEKNNWTGDVDYLAQTGDIVDRGDDTIALYRLMDDLRTQARGVGGDVISHLGNHEVMNSIGDWRYVYESEIKTFGSVADRQKMLANGWIGQSWRTNYTVTSRVPLHPSLGPPNTDYDPASKAASPLSHAALSFVHGGISPLFPHATPYPSSINKLGLSLLRKLQDRKQPPPHPPNAYPGLPDSATEAEKALYGGEGPLWYRGWALKDDKTVCAEIDDVLDKIGVRHLIMGHTPTFDHMVSRCPGGKIIIIDTGISHAYGGVLSALDVTYTLTPLNVSKRSERAGASAQEPVTNDKDSMAGQKNIRSYVEREIITAIYPHERVVLVSEEREVTGDFDALVPGAGPAL